MEKELCCERLQFMWDNHLLEERDSSEKHRVADGTEIYISFVKGFRVKRSFFFFRRDRIFYNCPFCQKELIYPAGVYIPREGFNFRIEIEKMGKTTERPLFEIPMSAFKEALFKTKMRCKTWPPKN